MELKHEIKAKFGTLKKFSELLGAPSGTIRSWTRKRNRRAPPAWVLSASIEAADFRKNKIDVWVCKDCGSTTEMVGAGICPKFCHRCGCGYFHAASLVHKTNKENAK